MIVTNWYNLYRSYREFKRNNELHILVYYMAYYGANKQITILQSLGLIN